jgi:hypothetical protein
MAEPLTDIPFRPLKAFLPLFQGAMGVRLTDWILMGPSISQTRLFPGFLP